MLLFFYFFHEHDDGEWIDEKAASEVERNIFWQRHTTLRRGYSELRPDTLALVTDHSHFFTDKPPAEKSSAAGNNGSGRFEARNTWKSLLSAVQTQQKSTV
jgi:hypothetical protein